MAARIALTYLVITVLWIFVTDALVAYLVQGQNFQTETLIVIQICKGILFMALTAALLYVYLKRTFTKEKAQRYQYQRLFEDNPNPMWVYEVDTLQFLAVNDTATKTYGYSKEEFLRMTLADIHVKDDIPQMIKYIKENQNNFSNQITARHCRKNGEVFFVDISSHFAEFEGKKARMVLAIDVNQRVLAEQENQLLTQQLSRQKNYLKSLLDAPSNFLVIRTDLNGTYTYINEAFNEKFGSEREVILGESFQLNTSTENKRLYQEVGEKCIESPGKIFPLRIHTLDIRNQKIVIDWELICIVDADRQAYEIQGIGQDVTEKVTYLQQVMDYRKRLDSILSTIHDVIWSCRADDFNILFINQACERLYGYKPEDF